MKTRIIIALLAITLAACAPALTNTEVQNTSVAIVNTAVALTKTALPTATPLPPTAVVIEATPLPPEPTIAVFTPDQEVLKTIIRSYFDIRYLSFNSLQLPDFGDLVSDEPDAKAFLNTEMPKLAIEIKHARLNALRYSYYKYSLDFHNIVVDPSTQVVTITAVEGNEVIYELSAVLNPGNPIVSHSGGIEHTIILRNEQGQWKIVSDTYNDDLWRQLRQAGTSTDELLRNMDEILRTEKAIPLPTQAMKPVVKPEPTQIEKWREYESALANKLMPLSPPEKVLCEWQLSGQSEQEVYVWAVCMEDTPVAEISQFFFPVVSIPAAIHLGADGAIQNVEIPEYGSNFLSDIRRIFPLDVQKGVADVGKMEEHLDWRRTHPDEPPLIVLSATPTP